MNTKLNYHYKDKKPEETIKNIEEFFKTKNIIIKQIAHYHSEINTYSCIYSLFWNGYNILSANGKGITKLYSKASCYAELYERFCNECLLNDINPFLLKDTSERRHQQYGYYFYPNEKEITIDKLLQDDYSKKFYMQCFGTKENIEKFLKIFTNNHLIGYPYKSLLNNKIIYQNFNCLIQQLGTTGLAAGNSLEEALVQGCSELFERIVIKKFFTNIQSQYFQINENILNIEHKNKLQLLRNNGYEPYLFDLSYNFYLPVCLIVVYNPLYNLYYYKFGSSPIFDIAIERCFTELYQGFCCLPTNLKLVPYNKEHSYKYITDTFHGLFGEDGEIVDISFIFNNIQQNNFNNKIFLNSENYSNKELLTYIKKILIKNNYNFNWIDISQSEKIFTIHIYIQNDLLIYRSRFYNVIHTLSIEQKTNFINLIEYIYNNLINLSYPIFNEKNISTIINNILILCTNIYPDIISSLNIISPLLGHKIFNVFKLVNISSQNDYNDVLQLIAEDYTNINYQTRDTRQLLWEQYKNNQYSNIYLFYILYIKNFFDLYHSSQYQNFVNILIN